jgi:hypothetical protein
VRRVVTRRAAVALGLLVALVAAATVAAYLVLDAQRTPEVDCATFRFDSNRWKAWQTDAFTGPYGPEHRPGSRFSAAQVAAHGLVECGELGGLTRRDVAARLGVPDGHAPGDRAWEYAVGPGQGLLGKGTSAEESLVVRFADSDRIVEGEVRTRRK